MERTYLGGLRLPPYRFTPCARKYTAVKRDWLVERRIKALISGMSQSKRDGFHLCSCCQLALHLAGPGFHTLVTTKFGQTSLAFFVVWTYGVKDIISSSGCGQAIDVIDYVPKIYGQA